MTKTRIVIVEDEALLAADLKNQLEQLGYEIIGIAPSKDKAMQLLCAQPPDLVLMDIQLKGEANGIDTAKDVKEHLGIPVIFLTAYADETLLKEAKISEPFGYMLKPVETRELHASIEMALYKAQMEKDRERLIKELEAALAEVKTLSGLLPICSRCKSIRDDEGYWQQIEKFIENRSTVQFSHSICPDCVKILYPDIKLS